MVESLEYNQLPIESEQFPVNPEFSRQRWLGDTLNRLVGQTELSPALNEVIKRADHLEILRSRKLWVVAAAAATALGLAKVFERPVRRLLGWHK